MLSLVKRAVRKLLHAMGLTTLRSAAAREAKLRAKLLDTQAALAASALLLTARPGADSELIKAIEALRALEMDLRARLARAEHSLEMERARWAPSVQRTRDGLRQSEFLDRDEVDDPWRERFAVSVLRSADPRALSGGGVRRLPLSATSPEAPGLDDAWKPASRATVSFVLVTHERVELLKLAVQRVRDQALSMPHEIIVVDDGCADGTAEWLVRQEDIVSVVLSDRSAGGHSDKSWGQLVNAGFRLAQGKWICLIGGVGLLLPGAAEKALRHVEDLAAKDCNVGGAAFYYRDWPKAERYFVQHTLGGMLMVDHGLFLKEALIDVGYAEEDLYGWHNADSDLSLKLWDAGYRIVDCPESFLEHVLLPSETQRLQRDESLQRDRHVLVERWAGRYVSCDAPEMFKQPFRRFSEHRDDGDTARLLAPFLEHPQESRP